MGRGHRHRLLLLTGVGWLISAAAVFLVAALLIPEASRSPHIWHRLIWIVLLIFWGGAGFYLTLGAPYDPKDHIERKGGIATPVAVVAGLYGLFSLALMLVHALLPDAGFVNSLHLILQTVLAMAAGAMFAFLSAAWTGATAGLRFDRSVCCTPRELHDLLELQESRLRSGPGSSADGLASSIRQLRETLLNSLHESSSLSESPAYRSICADVQKLCDSISAASTAGGSNGAVEEWTDRTRRILAEARRVASQQVRR